MESLQEDPEIWSVEEWLETIGMNEYTDGFVDNGYETIELVGQMKGEDMDAVGVASKQHRGILFTQARLLFEETIGLTPTPVPRSPKPTVSLSMSGSVSPATPSSAGYTEPWAAKVAPVPTPSQPGDYTEPWSVGTATVPTPSQPGDYTEPWSGNNPAQILTTSGCYTEPWKTGGSTAKLNGVVGNAVENTDGADHSTVVTKPPPLPPPNKPKNAVKKPPPSPGIKLPEYKRENGDKGLTKLQLKLKIRDELQKDAIVLSEQPYTTMDGNENEQKLIDLATDYAGRFEVESLGVYDALRDVWRHTNNKSEFATPSNMVLLGDPKDNYDEPFDVQPVSLPATTLAQAQAQAQTSGGDNSPKSQPTISKSRTLPSNSNQSVYEEPFDSKIGTHKQKTIIKNESQSSKTLPSPKIQRHDAPVNVDNKNPVQKNSTEKSPTTKQSGGLSRIFKRTTKPKVRSKSVKDVEDDPVKKGKLVHFSKQSKDTTSMGKTKHSSVEDLRGEGNPNKPGLARPVNNNKKSSSHSRASVAGYPSQSSSRQLSASRRATGSISSGSSDPSEAENSPNPRKSYDGKKFNTPPILKHNTHLDASSSDSDSQETPPALRKLRSLNEQTESDLDVNTRLDCNDSKSWMHISKSYDNLAETLAEEKRTKKRRGFLQRLLSMRKSKNTGSKKKFTSKDKVQDSVRDSATSSSLSVGESSLTCSISMPDIPSLDKMNPPDSTTEDSVFSSSKQPPLKPSRSVKRRSPEAGSVGSTSEHPQLLVGSVSDSATPNDSMIPVYTVTSSPQPEQTNAFNSPGGTNDTTGKWSDSEDPIPLAIKTDSKDSMSSRSNHGGSTKNSEIPKEGSLSRKPPPPPKPSILSTGKAIDIGVSATQKQISKHLSNTRPLVANSDASSADSKPPPKPARNIVTQQQRNESDADKPAAQKPPPKPSRNYKSIKILTSPPKEVKTTPPLTSKTLEDAVSSSESTKGGRPQGQTPPTNKKSSEVTDEGRRGSNTSTGSQQDSNRPATKPRPPRKPSPQVKPARRFV